MFLGAGCGFYIFMFCRVDEIELRGEADPPMWDAAGRSGAAVAWTALVIRESLSVSGCAESLL